MGSDDSVQKAQLAQQNAAQAAQQAKQNQILDQNNAALSPLLTGAVGYTPAQLAALNSSVLDQNALKYNQAAQLANANLAARGENGMTPLSGVGANGYSTLNAAKASDLSAGLNNVVQSNAALGQSNRLNAASILSGNAQTYAGNVGTYGSGASNALSNVTNAQNNGFFNNFAKGLGAGLGGAATSAASGGLGTFASTLGSGNYGW